MTARGERSNRWAGLRPRITAGLGVIKLAARLRLRRTLHGPVSFEARTGAVERLDIREGHMHIVGWSGGSGLLIATDERARHVDADHGTAPDVEGNRRSRFDIRLPGSERLVVRQNGRQVLSLTPIRSRDRWVAATRLCVSLLGLPIMQGRDLMAFLLRGDSAAGHRLERTLLNDPRAGPGPSTTDAWSQPELMRALEHVGGDGPLRIYLAHRLGGGSEHWLSGQLRPDAKAVVLRPGETAGRVCVELHGTSDPLRSEMPLTDLQRVLTAIPEKHLIYSCLVDPGDPLALARAAVAALGETDRFDLLIHDFFPLCPSYNLIDANGTYCDLPEPETCQACYARLVRLTGQRPPTIAAWRSTWHTLMTRADAIGIFSASSRDLITRVWPDVAPKVELWANDPKIPRRKLVPPRNRGVVLGVLGSIGHAKGAGVVRDLARHAGDDLDVVVIGTLDPGYRHPGITIHGPYAQSEISDLAERYGVTQWFIPAIWPETFSYTTRECLATGLPVAAFALGAQGEAVAAAAHGRVIAPDLRGPALLRAVLA